MISYPQDTKNLQVLYYLGFLKIKDFPAKLFETIRCLVLFTTSPQLFLCNKFFIEKF